MTKMIKMNHHEQKVMFYSKLTLHIIFIVKMTKVSKKYKNLLSMTDNFSSIFDQSESVHLSKLDKKT